MFSTREKQKRVVKSVEKHTSLKKRSQTSIGKTMLQVLTLVLALSPYVTILIVFGLVLMWTITQ